MLFLQNLWYAPVSKAEISTKLHPQLVHPKYKTILIVHHIFKVYNNVKLWVGKEVEFDMDKVSTGRVCYQQGYPVYFLAYPAKPGAAFQTVLYLIQSLSNYIPNFFLKRHFS